MMKSESLNSRFCIEKYLPTYEGRPNFIKKSILTFSKWTKKMSKIGYPKNSLLTKKSSFHFRSLSSQLTL